MILKLMRRAAFLAVLPSLPLAAQEQHFLSSDIENGSRLYRSNCFACHGPEGASIPGVDFRRGQFEPLKGWLNEKIHSPGQRYRADELCQRVTGKPLSHKPLLHYMRQKYAPLYGI